MKKNNLNLLLLLFLTCSLISCNEEFLNDPQPTDAVTSSVIFGSREGANAFVSGIMRNFRSQFTATDLYPQFTVTVPVHCNRICPGSLSIDCIKR